MTWIEQSASPYSTETVWTAGLAGTGLASHGRSLTVGHDADWAPEYLLLLAAESCFMSTLLALARQARVEVLGYVSKGQLQMRSENGEAPSILLTPCIVVASENDAACVGRLANAVTREAVVARLLGERLHVSLDVRVVPGGSSR
jgi:organic hydroperoxide reductase OsmC/OhrA